MTRDYLQKITAKKLLQRSLTAENYAGRGAHHDAYWLDETRDEYLIRIPRTGRHFLPAKLDRLPLTSCFYTPEIAVKGSNVGQALLAVRTDDPEAFPPASIHRTQQGAPIDEYVARPWYAWDRSSARTALMNLLAEKAAGGSNPLTASLRQQQDLFSHGLGDPCGSSNLFYEPADKKLGWIDQIDTGAHDAVAYLLERYDQSASRLARDTIERFIAGTRSSPFLGYDFLHARCKRDDMQLAPRWPRNKAYLGALDRFRSTLDQAERDAKAMPPVLHVSKEKPLPQVQLGDSAHRLLETLEQQTQTLRLG